MQVKKSQKIFEFFDFFKGIQKFFCAMGGCFEKLSSRAKPRIKSADKKCAMEIFALRIQMLVKE